MLFSLGMPVTVVSLRHFTVALLWSAGVVLTLFCQNKRAFAKDLYRVLKHPVFFVFTVLVLWSFFSSAWSIKPLQSFKASLSQTATLFLIAVLFTHLHSLSRRSFSWAMQVLTGLVFLSIFLLFLQIPLFFKTFKVLLGYGWSTLKPNSALLLVVAIPLAAYRHLHLRQKGIALLLVLFSILLAYQVDYQAGVFGLIIAGIAAGLGYRFSYFIPMFSAYLSAFLCLSLPFIFHFLVPALDLKALWFTSGLSSFAHRLYIWDFITKQIWEKAFLGWGASTSRGFPTDGLTTFEGSDILPSHPHNHIMQLWLELGGVGALILAVLHFMLFRSIAKLESRQATAWAMLFSVMSFVILSLSHSIWHKWWMTWLGAAGVLMAVVLKRAQKISHDL
ncbi:MAG: O-antigen ligase family protein [Alphaproteobacteria bacterium]|nr:O-antigen ligase family protein [Alphaproteobacteria bacterium]NCQ66372.1 O-antigen ligase family protein [Alphaproteobacteria bacterium]NCT06858.1 O-antigen ligase family protein [Alphaproteobacteria bacterium]